MKITKLPRCFCVGALQYSTVQYGTTTVFAVSDLSLRRRRLFPVPVCCCRRRCCHCCRDSIGVLVLEEEDEKGLDLGLFAVYITVIAWVMVAIGALYFVMVSKRGRWARFRPPVSVHPPGQRRLKKLVRGGKRFEVYRRFVLSYASVLCCSRDCCSSICCSRVCCSREQASSKW